jgi:hypothetical protein
MWKWHRAGRLVRDGATQRGGLLWGRTPGGWGALALTRTKMRAVFYLWKYIFFLPMMLELSSTHNCFHGIVLEKRLLLHQLQLTFSLAKQSKEQEVPWRTSEICYWGLTFVSGMFYSDCRRTVAAWVTFVRRICELPVSDFVSEDSCPDWGASWLSSVFEGKCLHITSKK